MASAKNEIRTGASAPESASASPPATKSTIPGLAPPRRTIAYGDDIVGVESGDRDPTELGLEGENARDTDHHFDPGRFAAHVIPSDLRAELAAVKLERVPADRFQDTQPPSRATAGLVASEHELSPETRRSSDSGGVTRRRRFGLVLGVAVIALAGTVLISAGLGLTRTGQEVAPVDTGAVSRPSVIEPPAPPSMEPPAPELAATEPASPAPEKSAAPAPEAPRAEAHQPSSRPATPPAPTTPAVATKPTPPKAASSSRKGILSKTMIVPPSGGSETD